jgi:hypothetical protein
MAPPAKQTQQLAEETYSTADRQRDRPKLTEAEKAANAKKLELERERE